MVEFGGWDMPVQYPAGTMTEHLRTRTKAGLFDVSHMGEIEVRGADAIPFVNRLTSNDATKLIDGQAQYSALTTPPGTVIDDLLVYRFAENHLLLVVNAGTTDKDWDWIISHRGDENVELRNASAEYCQIAVQGPNAISILQKLTTVPLSEIKYYHFREGAVDGVSAIVSRTGYTGEDGFEISIEGADAERVARALLDESEVLPIGLGARDSLRLEAVFELRWRGMRRRKPAPLREPLVLVHPAHDEFAERVDEILKKISEQGKESLTDEERNVLIAASQKYRNKE